jgi:hypothetical protein
MKTENENAPSPGPSQTPATPYASTQWSANRMLNTRLSILKNINHDTQRFQLTRRFSSSLSMRTHFLARNLDSYRTVSSFRASPYAHYGYGSHYPQATYPNHFQQYTPQTGAQAGTVPRQQGGSADTSDLATLNDALGSAGVDLRVSRCGSDKINLNRFVLSGRRRAVTEVT